MAKEFDDRDRDGDVGFAPSGSTQPRSVGAGRTPGKSAAAEAVSQGAQADSLASLALEQGQRIIRGYAAAAGRLGADEHTVYRSLAVELKGALESDAD